MKKNDVDQVPEVKLPTMQADWKGITDLPESVLEQIVGVLAKHKDLTKFYGFGLSSKLFYKPTLHVLHRENLFFPIDIGKNESNMTLMKYLSKYDDEEKEKFGIRLVFKNSSKLTQPQLFEWVKDCKGLKRMFLDKVDFRNPVCSVNCKQIFLQNCKTLEMVKFQNVLSDPTGIGYLEEFLISCKKLKDLEIIWNVKSFDDEPARSFKYSLFDIMDASPRIETLRIQVPDKVPKHALLLVDIERRFFYQKTGFSLQRPQNILPKEHSKTQIRKMFSVNGEPSFLGGKRGED